MGVERTFQHDPVSLGFANNPGTDIYAHALCACVQNTYQHSVRECVSEEEVRLIHAIITI